MKATNIRQLIARIVHAAALVLALSAFQTVQAQSDNFNNGNDVGWTHYDPLAPFGAGATYSFPSGGYRIQAPASPDPTALGGARAGSFRSDGFYSDFSMSIDVVNWDNSLQQAFGLAARISQPGLGTTDGYLFSYAPAFAQAIFSRVDNENSIPLSGVPLTLDPSQDYRFTFSGTGSSFLAQIYNVTDLVTPVASFTGTDSTYSSGVSGIFQAPTAPNATLDATFDNFQAQAVPEPSTMALLGLAALVGFAARKRTALRSKS